MSRVTGSVFGYPSTTMPRESPTRRTSIPARSRIRAIVKSYAVQTAIFSPRSFIARRSGTRIGFIRSPNFPEEIVLGNFRKHCFIRVPHAVVDETDVGAPALVARNLFGFV